VSVADNLKQVLRAVSNRHRQGAEKNILLCATARGGSTWVMELIASQPGMKFYDEPFNVRRDNVKRTKLFPNWESIMPDAGDPERFVSYLDALVAGRHGQLNPPPFRPYHRYATNRIVFKLHELEHVIGLLARRCNCEVVYLLRHPVPTTLSRSQYPRLDLFVASRYYQELIGPARQKEVERLVAGGTNLQRGIVSWCYENLVPLRYADFEGLFVTYEELVVNPEKSCDLLIERLRLSDRSAMLQAFQQPATNITMSTHETQQMMTDADERQRRRYLVTKWQKRVTPDDQRAVTAILDLFGLDVYTGEDPLPHAHLHFSDTRALLERDPVATR
jgi:hypothetical protein